MTENGERRRPLTDQERRSAERARAKALQDFRDASDEEPAPVTSPGKFTGPIGIDDEGRFMPPTSPDEKRRKEEIRRRAQRDDGS